MRNSFFRLYLTLLALYIVEIFLTGYTIVLQDSAIVAHFSQYSATRFVEMLFFHFFGISILLYIVLHLLAVTGHASVGKRYILPLFGAFYSSYLLWYLFSFPLLKLVASMTLCLLLLYLAIYLYGAVPRQKRDTPS